MVHDRAVGHRVGAGLRRPVDGAVLEALELAAADVELAGGGEAERSLGAAARAVGRADRAEHDLRRTRGRLDDLPALEVLDHAARNVAAVGGRVAEAALLPALVAPQVHEVAHDQVRPGLMRPVDGAVLEVDVAAVAVGRGHLARLRVAQRRLRPTDLVVAGADAAPHELGAGGRVPVGAAVGEVLRHATVAGLVLRRQARTHVVEVLDAIADGPRDDAIGSAVAVGKLQRVRDLRPCLVHLELPVRPGVGAGIAKLQRDRHIGPASALGEGVGGHPRQHLEAEARGVLRDARVLRRRGVPLASVAAARGGVERYALEPLHV